MVSLHVVFWMFVAIFAVIGALRGWAREILVTFSLILSIFILSIIESYSPDLEKSIAEGGAARLFWFRFAITVALVVFGYQSVSISRINASPRLIRAGFQDNILGFLVGAMNGFLIVGTLWYYLQAANYPLDFITAPQAGTIAGDAALKLVPYLAPVWLTTPTIYFVVAISFGLVLALFI